MLNKEQLLYLSEKQEQLDNYIISTKGLELNEDMDNKKLIALLVEISEFVNECRAFKFWSNKPSSEKEVVLEEFVDGLHFIISIGNNVLYNFSNFEYKKEGNGDLNIWTLEMYNSIMSFYSFRSHKNYAAMLNKFLNCLFILNFSSEDVINSYNFKNKTNFERQDNNY
ncbi:dUTP diphosphatase [Spiroplasma corruscae]|uniref:dUTP diphosphatase n=1 Tax=Spiroplasma corruscae TaxID=216934 RepID=A0A222ENC6_9MOLU|nr:dUTP diphosphatase [Spiroplasma corruscae]ASP27998.1 dUTP diphosphatase [Spiroplasma corruscae]